MSHATADDQLREEVERRLRAAVEAAASAPFALPRAIESCLRRRAEAARDVVVQPVRLIRSLVELVAGGVPPADRSIIDAAVVEPPPAPSSEDDRRREDLPIEEYESLAASQVAARLDGLSDADLRTIRRFEASHRGRRTVLGKIDQLLG